MCNAKWIAMLRGQCRLSKNGGYLPSVVILSLFHFFSLPRLGFFCLKISVEQNDMNWLSVLWEDSRRFCLSIVLVDQNILFASFHNILQTKPQFLPTQYIGIRVSKESENIIKVWVKQCFNPIRHFHSGLWSPMTRESLLAADAGRFTYMRSSHVLVKGLHPVLSLLRTDTAWGWPDAQGHTHWHKMKEHVLRLKQGKIFLHMQ